MKQPVVQYFAITIELILLTQLTQGSNLLNDVEIKGKEQPWKNRESHVLEHNLVRWRNKPNDPSKDEPSVVNNATYGLNDRRNVLQQEIHETATGHINDSINIKDANVGFFDPKEKPSKNFQGSFGKVLRRRLKRPRQEIEFIEDSQGSETKQNVDESPRYQEIAQNDNSGNSGSNGYGNNYVTIVDNDDEKADTDSYSTLSSDLAKSEYTNVESSMNEGANEESQILGKEVNDVMGVLAKSDSRINQFVGGGRQTPGQGGILPLEQAETTANDDVVISVDSNKEDSNGTNKNPATSPQPDVTLIVDQEEVNPSGFTHPGLSKDIWDVIQQVRKNFTVQEQDHRGEQSQSDNGTQWSSYLPPPKSISENSKLTHSGNSPTELEANLKIFDGSEKQSENNNTTNKPDSTHNDDNGTKIFLSGDAEEGNASPTSQPNVSSSYLHQPETGYIFNSKSHSYNQKVDSSGDNSVFPNSSKMAPFRMDNTHGNRTHIQSNVLGPYKEHSGSEVSDEQVDAISQNIDKYKRPSNELPYPLTPKGTSEVDGSSVNFPTEAWNSIRGKPNNKGISSDVNAKEAADNTTYTRQDESLVQENRPYKNTNASSLISKAGSNGSALFKVPMKDKPEDVRIIYVEPADSKTSSKNWPANRTTSFQGDGYYTKPNGPMATARESSQHNGNKTSDLKHTDSRLQQQQSYLVSAADTSSNQRYGPSSNIQIKTNNREPAQGQPEFVASQGNGQAVFSTHQESEGAQKGFDASHREEEMSSETVHTGNPPLESWSREYHKLVEKLYELFKQAQRNAFQDNNKNPETYDVETMMKEVSRFHNLFTGGNREQKGNRNYGGIKGMLMMGREDEAKEGVRENGKIVNPSGYLSSVGSNGNGNTNDIQKHFWTKARVYKDVPGEVRSIQTPTSLSHRNPETKEIKINVTFVNQQLASKQHSSDHVKDNKQTNSSETVSSEDHGPSSHQLLMTYFRNETDLRKHLQNVTGIQTNGSAVGKTAEMKGQDIQLGNSTNSAGVESKGIKDEPSTTGGDAITNLPNGSALPWPSQVRNVSKEEEEGSLAKYIQDFIAMISPNRTVETNGISGTLGGSSTKDVSTSSMVTMSSSEASKKENVTDMKNREIIVVSPESLKDLMKNRTHSSSPKKDHPVTGGKGENTTAKLEAKILLNTTAIKSERNISSLSGKTTAGNRVSNLQPALHIGNDTSKKETDASERKEADLNLLYREELKSLEISLSRDFMSGWIYYQKSLDEIGITPDMLRSGIANLGSSQRLKSVFKKALAGADVNVLVVGGSISAGGGIEKDRGNIEGVYHKALNDWWNKTVTPITTSQLKINTVAIGGTDSEYFSYCVKNYMRSLPDIVIWELAANDYQRYKGRNFAPAKPLEQLTRIILGLPSHPALILANFFRGNYYRTAVGQDCPDSEDEGGKAIAQYYKLTSLSWRNVVCSSLAGQELDMKTLFSSDGYHPSILGHVQMSTLLISYLKGVFEETISQEMILSRNNTLQIHHQDEVLTTLPKPIYDDPESPRPYCWTLLTPDYGGKLRNTLPDLEFTEAMGFQFANISHWPVRRDRLRCLKAMQTGAMLKMKFVVPSHEDQYSDDDGPRKERELAITTHNSFGGMGVIWVDDNQQEGKIIKEEGGQRRTQVDVLTRMLAPGVHTVTVSALQPGFCLSAVAVL